MMTTPPAHSLPLASHRLRRPRRYRVVAGADERERSADQTETEAGIAWEAGEGSSRSTATARASVAAERARASPTGASSQGKRRITGREALERIRGLAIPPAWEDVWICSNAAGHIQATGVDARGRRQYRYHDQWHEERSAEKFDRVVELAAHLPRFREQVARDLRRRGMPTRKRLIREVTADVASHLGNTPAITRSAYIDPRVFDAFEDGRTIARALTSSDIEDIERAVRRILRAGSVG